MASKRLKPAVRPRRAKSNAWWYRLAAMSFLLKVVLLMGLFFAVRTMAIGVGDRAQVVSPTPSQPGAQ